MKTPLARSLITLAVAASAALLAGCLEQTRQAAHPVPVTVAPPPASEPAILSRPDPIAANVTAPVAEIARLHLSGLDESVVKAFVEKSTNSANPSADELIYLRDIGISPRIITALIQQTARIREQDNALRASQPATAPAASQPNITIIAANAPPPAAPVLVIPQPAAIAPAPAPQVALAAPAAPAALPPQVNVFYQQLQPYGTWMQVADFGWCWQPSVAVATPSWRPYADRGRWLHTDSGWYWQSDYAWGWAPFHYGRWVQHTRSGWLWVPDTQWGPAWVVWRSSDSHCGWAPLPPSAVFVAGHGIHFGGTRVALNFDFGLSRHHFTFVPFTRFCDRNPHYYALTPTVVQNVYNQTTVINNIQVNNNVVVNSGVSADRIAVITRSEIRKVAVREAGPQELSPGAQSQRTREADALHQQQRRVTHRTSPRWHDARREDRRPPRLRHHQHRRPRAHRLHDRAARHARQPKHRRHQQPHQRHAAARAGHLHIARATGKSPRGSPTRDVRKNLRHHAQQFHHQAHGGASAAETHRHVPKPKRELTLPPADPAATRHQHAAKSDSTTTRRDVSAHDPHGVQKTTANERAAPRAERPNAQLHCARRSTPAHDRRAHLHSATAAPVGSTATRRARRRAPHRHRQPATAARHRADLEQLLAV